MNQAGKTELASIKQELRSIINELEDISNGIRRDFEGIGNEYCANSIDCVIERYRSVLRDLNNIDTSKVSEEYKRAHGGGGGRF